MKLLIAIAMTVLLTGCLGFGQSPLGGVPPDTIKAIAEAGGGCVDVESPALGKATVSVGASEKGALKNDGGVQIKCGNNNITIDVGTSARAKPAPGTTTVITTPPQPGTVQTIVTPPPK